MRGPGEDVTQAVARDIVAEALVNIEQKLGMVPVMTVHDELVYEDRLPRTGESDPDACEYGP